MVVDEKKLGGAILANGSAIAPGAFLFIAHFILAGNQWIVAPPAIGLSAYYHVRGWDGRHLVAWGAAAFAVSASAIQSSMWAADSLAISGYWLCVAGLLRMAVELAKGSEGREASDERASAGQKGGWDTRNAFKLKMENPAMRQKDAAGAKRGGTT